MFTGSTRSADEWHGLGQEEVERLRGKITALARLIIPQAKTFEDVLAGIDALSFPTPNNSEELEAHIKTLIERAERSLPDIWGQGHRIIPTIEPLDVDQEGEVMASYDLDMGTMTFNSNSTEPFHEWAPIIFHEYTHHLQAVTKPPYPDLPEIVLSPGLLDTSTAEGGALYAEKLAAELDLFESDLERIAQLNEEMERAARLVVDTGIHAKGWTREQAIDYYRSQTTFNRETAEIEIDRYIANPGQALCYMAGLLEIEAMRAKAEQALGEAFDLRAFNQVLLSAGGSAPMAAVKDAVDRWIATQEMSETGLCFGALKQRAV